VARIETRECDDGDSCSFAPVLDGRHLEQLHHFFNKTSRQSLHAVHIMIGSMERMGSHSVQRLRRNGAPVIHVTLERNDARPIRN
jgi:hypothetical protein